MNFGEGYALKHTNGKYLLGALLAASLSIICKSRTADAFY